MPHNEVSPRQLGAARSLRSSMSDAEKRLWYHLRAHVFCGASFRRQAPIGNYIVDFACHDAGLIIELDGGQHGTASAARCDTQRTAWLATRGYRVLRFWNNDVLRNTEGVLELIAVELEKRTPPLRPAPRAGATTPPAGGGGGGAQ